MHFEVIGQILWIETIATGRKIRELRRLNRVYGKAAWRKLKGFAKIKLINGTVKLAELHWYEGHGVGKKEMKIKRFLE